MTEQAPTVDDTYDNTTPGTTVYGRKIIFPHGGFAWDDVKNSLHTHEAVLHDIKETDPLPCQHEMVEYSTKGARPVTSGKCLQCGKDVVAVWKTK